LQWKYKTALLDPSYSSLRPTAHCDLNLLNIITEQNCKNHWGLLKTEPTTVIGLILSKAPCHHTPAEHNYTHKETKESKRGKKEVYEQSFSFTIFSLNHNPFLTTKLLFVEASACLVQSVLKMDQHSRVQWKSLQRKTRDKR
jgi:hypothetical protein